LCIQNWWCKCKKWPNLLCWRNFGLFLKMSWSTWGVMKQLAKINSIFFLTWLMKWIINFLLPKYNHYQLSVPICIELLKILHQFSVEYSPGEQFCFSPCSNFCFKLTTTTLFITSMCNIVSTATFWLHYAQKVLTKSSQLIKAILDMHFLFSEISKNCFRFTLMKTHLKIIIPKTWIWIHGRLLIGTKDDSFLLYQQYHPSSALQCVYIKVEHF